MLFRSYAAGAALAAVAHALPQPQATNEPSSSSACNNSPSLCDKAYNKITHLGAHNSYALRDDSTGDSLSGNQYLNATVALDAGLRLLQLQTHSGDTTLQLCHSSCDLLDAGPLEDWLVKINDWMNDNPNDVVTLIIVNSDSATPEDFNQALQGSGIGDKAYTPTSTEATGDWPTLQSMIDQNTRLVTFVTNLDYSQSAPAILPEFDFVFETAFEVTELNGFNCTLDRPSNLDSAASALSSNYLSMVNHFKYQEITAGIQLPDVDTIGTVNSASTDEQGALGTHLSQCNQEWGAQPNFVLVDFWDEGDTVVATDRINNVDDAEGRKKAQGGGGTSAGARIGGREYGALVAFFSAAVFLI